MQRDIIKFMITCTNVFTQRNRYSYQILIKLEFSRHILENSNTKFNKNPPRSGRVVPCGRPDRRTGRWTERHDESTSRFSQFCE